jgi:hypothetical protein
MTERAVLACPLHVPGAVRMSRRRASLYDLGMATYDTGDPSRSLAEGFVRARSDG